MTVRYTDAELARLGAAAEASGVTVMAGVREASLLWATLITQPPGSFTLTDMATVKRAAKERSKAR